MELEQLRDELDEVDKKLLELFIKRMNLSEEVAKVKKEKNIPIFNGAREQEILQTRTEMAGEWKNYARSLFTELMALSKQRQWDILNGDDKKYGLIGRVLGHSFSKVLHEELGCNNYQLIELEPEELENFLRDTDLSGMNVTIPYKMEAKKYCDVLSEEAMAIGSVNTLVKHWEDKEAWYGYNTDVHGFLYTVELAGMELSGAKVLVLGSGGASKAVSYGCKKLGAGEVIIISRKGENNYDNLEKHYDADVIINATPVGMEPNIEEQPVDLEPFTKLSGVIDLIYNPRRTKLLQQAEALHINCIDGLAMLVSQAVHAQELFKNREFPMGITRRTQASLTRKLGNLILIGMPGCGKSSIAKAIGELSGREVIDTDTYIEEKEGMSIPEIFKKGGEALFRELETKALKELVHKKGIIISTGGGVVLSEENITYLKYNGYIYHIERDLDKLSREGRPLSEGADLKELYQRRLSFYAQCRDSVFENNGSIEDIARRIWEDFCEHLR
ncbi:MAG: chorismate mutase [Lachnospiraceae bacterium]|nr:chorismate mutase [Lachnospiraceae bacterium]